MFFSRKKSTKIVIIGLNQTAIFLARSLSKKNDVIILYENSAINPNNLHIDVIFEEIEGKAISSLRNIDTKEVDYLLALTENEEFNLFVASIAKELGIKKSIAMISSNQFMDLKLNIDLVFNQFQIIIDQTGNRIKATRMLKIRNFIPGKASISELIVNNNDPFSYLQIKNIEIQDGLIIAIQRGSTVFLPDPEERLYPGDKTYFLFKRGVLNNFFKIFRSYKFKKKLFVMGGTDLGLTFINAWDELFDPIIIVEKDLERCNKLAGYLEKVLILFGEGIDLQMLKDEGLEESSVFITVSEDDYINLLSSFAAVNAGCKHVITLINNPDYQAIGKLLNLENILTIPELISEYIMEFINSGQGATKFVLGEQIYSAEFTLTKINKIINKRLLDLDLPKGILVGILKRGNELIIPDGSTVIHEEDSLIVFFDQKQEERVYRLFK